MNTPRADGRWNHNLHYHPVVLDAVPRDAQLVLDVGCGEGMLTRDLRAVAEHVVGIDLDPASIELARSTTNDASIEYVCDDFFTAPFAPRSFDAVVSVAAIHHMPAVDALRRMRALTRPGGVVAVIGLARSRTPVDLAWNLAGGIATRVHKRTKTYWEHSAPMCWPPPESYGAMRRLAAHELPRSQFRRRVLWRYSIVATV